MTALVLPVLVFCGVLVAVNGVVLWVNALALQSLRRAIRETDRLNEMLADVVVLHLPQHQQPAPWKLKPNPDGSLAREYQPPTLDRPQPDQPTKGGAPHGRFG